jgi:hypothetical protein
LVRFAGNISSRHSFFEVGRMAKIHKKPWVEPSVEPSVEPWVEPWVEPLVEPSVEP